MEREKILSLVAAKGGKAKVTKLEIPQALAQFNTANNTLRVRVVAMWANETDDAENSCQSLLRETTGNNEFSQIANLDGFDATIAPKGVDNWPYKDNNPQTKVDAYKARVLNKFFTATKYTVTVASLCKDLGGELATVDRVHDKTKKRTYPTLTDCTLDSPNDDDKVIMWERLQNRLQRRLAEKRLFVGPFTQDTNTNHINAQGGAVSNDVTI